MLILHSENITSLENYFKEKFINDYHNITELDCSYNNLEDLKGCPPNVKKLFCAFNNLRSLEGCPQNLEQLYCNDNLLTSLAGCPANLKILHCENNSLQNLEDCPKKLKILSCWNNPLSGEWSCLSKREIMTKLQLQGFLQGLELVNKTTDYKWRVVRRFCHNLLDHWYIPDANGYTPYAHWSWKMFQKDCQNCKI